MTEKDNNLVQRSILITKAHKEYLDAHQKINLSGFVRDKLDEAIEAEGE